MARRAPLPPPLTARPFSTAEALSVTRGRLRSSDLARPFHGVRIPTALAWDVRAACVALETRLNTDAFFCHTTAALLYGLPLPPRAERVLPLHVGVFAPNVQSRQPAR